MTLARSAGSIFAALLSAAAPAWAETFVIANANGSLGSYTVTVDRPYSFAPNGDFQISVGTTITISVADGGVFFGPAGETTGSGSLTAAAEGTLRIIYGRTGEFFQIEFVVVAPPGPAHGGPPPGQVGQTPGQGDLLPPGQGGVPPGLGAAPPGQGGPRP